MLAGGYGCMCVCVNDSGSLYECMAMPSDWLSHLAAKRDGLQG